MEWIKIDPDNLPNAEVLAACFDQKKTDYCQKVIGDLFKTDKYVYCDGDSRIITFVTHYIEINKHDLV